MKYKDNYPNSHEYYTPAAIHKVVQDMCVGFGEEKIKPGNNLDEGPHSDYILDRAMYPEQFDTSDVAEMGYTPPYILDGSLSLASSYILFQPDRDGLVLSVELREDDTGRVEAEAYFEYPIDDEVPVDLLEPEIGKKAIENLFGGGQHEDEAVKRAEERIVFRLEFSQPLELSPDQLIDVRDQLAALSQRFEASRPTNGVEDDDTEAGDE